MDPLDERSRPPAQEDRPATNSDARSVHRGYVRIWMSAGRGPEYEAGFCDGWADRAEYERRTRPVEPLTFDDGVELGRLLGPGRPPAPEAASRELTAEELAQYEEMRRRTRRWLGWTE